MKKALVLALLLVFASVRPAHAASFGDAALTVSIATATGAILGLSTLPFYEDSGKHGKNVFYGAALGAVAGVFISAYSGVQEGASGDDDEAMKKRSSPSLYSSNSFQNHRAALLGEATQAKNTVLVWAPVANFHF